MKIPSEVKISVKEANKKERKKILILSLGTGAATYNRMEGDIPEQMYNNNTYFFSYSHANYSFDGGKEKTDAEFIAYPLIQQLKPDYVFLVGTVKSVWTAYYSRFVSEEKRSKESIQLLYEIEKEGNAYLDDEDILANQRKIQDIYDNDMPSQKGGESYIRIILTKYGLNEDETQFNYKQIRSIQDYLQDKTVGYDVSFDITHSFRSLPLYNLINLNYIRQLTDIDIEIEHIYYGNLDVSREIEYVPIVDLKGIDYTLKITNAMSSFMNSGDARLLIKVISNDELKEVVRRFDWAIQISDIGSIEDSLSNLIEQLSKNIKSANEKDRDLYGLMQEICKINFPTKEDFEKLRKVNHYPYIHGEIQYIIAKWMYSVNKSGSSLVCVGI